MPKKKQKPKKSPFNQAHETYISSVQQEVDAIKKRKESEKQLFNACIDQYTSETSRIELIKRGKILCYSKNKLQEIESHFQAWNFDELDINVVMDIYDLQIYIDEHNNNKFVNKIKNVFINESENSNNGN